LDLLQQRVNRFQLPQLFSTEGTFIQVLLYPPLPARGEFPVQKRGEISRKAGGTSTQFFTVLHAIIPPACSPVIL
jgi:hypothetical protein